MKREERCETRGSGGRLEQEQRRMGQSRAAAKWDDRPRGSELVANLDDGNQKNHGQQRR